MIQYVTINLDKPRRLRFGMGVTIEFEQMTGIKTVELFKEQRPFEIYAKALWIMLRQEDEKLTFSDVIKLVDEHAKNISEVIIAASKAITVAYKSDDKSPNGEAPAGSQSS
jgi:hypothetical protein